MAQTRVTCDVSSGGKVKADAVTAMIRHWARDVDAANGIYRPHSNEGIDPSRSINNMTLFPTDGPRDEWVRPDSVEEIQDRLQERLATVTGRKRKDAVVMRGVVLGLSPEWVEEHTPDWKTQTRDQEKFMNTLQPVVERVIEKAGGAENVILVTGHFDEVVPQIQIAVTPVTEDGRLRQNDFDLFKSPGSLAKLHKQIRKELKDSGVDVILESSERSREHLSNHDYARKADKERAKEIEELGKKQKEIADKQAKLDADKAELPKLRQQAFSEGRKQGRKQGESEGYAKGLEEGQVEAGARVAAAEQQAEDIVAQAQANVAMIREERERLEEENEAKRSRNEALDQEIQGKQSTVQQVEDEITAKHNELQQVQQELDAAESSRDDMTQLDSDFLDEMLKYPKVQQRYEKFKQGRTTGLAALGGNKDYYERTVGENKQRAAAIRHASQQQQQQNQQQPTQPGYKPIV